MKIELKRKVALCATAATFAIALNPTNALALVWAGPAGTTDAPISGTWDTTTANLWTATTGPGTSAWVNASQADLGGATSPVSLTLASALSVTNLNFNSSNYSINTVTANTLSMTGALSLAGSSSASIGSLVTLLRTGNGTYTFISGNTGTLNIASGAVVGTAGTGIHSISGTGLTINVNGELAGISGTDGSNNLFALGSVAGDNVAVNVDNGGLLSVGGRSLRIANGTGAAATVNVVDGGTLQMTGVQTGTTEVGHIYVGFGASATGTLNVSGGSVTTGTNAGGGELVVAGGTSTGILNISGGTVTSTARMVVGELGNATVNLSGTGSLSVGAASPGINFGSQAASTGTSVFSLNGGTLVTPAITNLAVGSTDTFNFNGGTLKANASNAAFTGTNAYTANVKEGGAIIDTNGFNITYGQVLAHGGTAATDGGLTKNGLGTLTLSAAETFTGATAVNAGSLQITTGSINSSSSLGIASGATVEIQSNVSLNDTITLALVSGSNLNLNFTGIEAIGILSINGQVLATGNYTLSTLQGLSGGVNFTGNSGASLQVTAVPEPTPIALIFISSAVFVIARRKRAVN